MILVDALGHAGNVADGLRIADEGLASFVSELPPEEWIFGFNSLTLFHCGAVRFSIGWAGYRRGLKS
jgi:hypothetical protein